MNRIKDKSEEIQSYLEELEKILPKDFEEYKESLEKRAACERYFEKIVEASIDLGFLILKQERFPLPEDNKIFDSLFEKSLIRKETANKMKKAKGMRNIIAHQYGKIDDELVFESITEELIKDVETYLKDILKI